MTTTPSTPGDNVTDAQIAALSQYFFDNVYVMDNGNVRKLDPAIDTQSICFDKKKIDKLFADNPTADKLTIHLGMHNSTIFPPSNPKYEHKMMVVLSAKTSAAAPVPSGGGSSGGQDNGTLCPPETIC